MGRSVWAGLVLGIAACGSAAEAPPAADAGPSYHVDVRPDASPPPDAADGSAADAKTRVDRMERHDGTVLAAARLQVVYVGDAGAGGAPSVDPLLEWLVTSRYWATMNQYGVGPGSMLPSLRIPTRALLPEGTVTNGLVDPDVLEARVLALLHPGGADADGGDGGQGASDAAGPRGPDAGSDAGGLPPPLVPKADAYVLFLPDGVNVRIPQAQGGDLRTCLQVGGYHAYDGLEPYAILPPCRLGRSGLAISHEIAEMVTDPVVDALGGHGWFSDADVANAGGEIGDLCNASITVEGWLVTQLWSNADGDCEPATAY